MFCLSIKFKSKFLLKNIEPRIIHINNLLVKYYILALQSNVELLAMAKFNWTQFNLNLITMQKLYMESKLRVASCSTFLKVLFSFSFEIFLVGHIEEGLAGAIAGYCTLLLKFINVISFDYFYILSLNEERVQYVQSITQNFM